MDFVFFFFFFFLRLFTLNQVYIYSNTKISPSWLNGQIVQSVLLLLISFPNHYLFINGPLNLFNSVWLLGKLDHSDQPQAEKSGFLTRLIRHMS